MDTFITDLYCLSEYCKFGTLREELIRDRIVIGMQNVKLSEKLQMDSGLTLEAAINSARQNELVKKQEEMLQSGVSPQLDGVKERKGKRGSQFCYPKQCVPTKCMRWGIISEKLSCNRCHMQKL